MSKPGGRQPSPARAVALEVLRASFERGEPADQAFRIFATELDGRERSHAQHLAYGAVQRRGSTEAAIERLTGRSPGSLDPEVAAVLRLGLFELLYSGGAASHATVNEAVNLVRIAGAGQATGFVNAVMRRAAAEREAILAELGREEAPAEAATGHSVPAWLARMWWEELGPEEALSLMRAANRPAERALRINTSRWLPADAARALGEAGVEASEADGEGPLAAPEVLVVEGRWGGLIEDWVEEGLVVPQSRGSAAVVEVLDPRPGDRVLELCAGPGTKTGQIAARMRGEGELTAVELDPARAGQVREQLDRLDLAGAVSVVEADAAELNLGGERFDRILVDAPCSDLGTLSSRPDVRWRKSPELIARLAGLQERILDRAARHLAPGGSLVYSTCTISPDENERLMSTWLQRASPQPAEGRGGAGIAAIDLGGSWPGLASSLDPRFLQIRPDRDGTTGFFIARCVYCPGRSG